MMLNGKRFNDVNREFQVWRGIDMLEKAVLSLRRKLAEVHRLPGLMDLVEEQAQAEVQTRLESIAEEV